MRQCPRGLTSKPINLSNFGKVITRHIVSKSVKMSHSNFHAKIVQFSKRHLNFSVKIREKIFWAGN